MAVLYHVWVPAVALAHVLGLGLLLYSLEKVSGAVSKSWRRLTAGEQTTAKRLPSKRADGAAEGPQREPSGCDPVKLVAAAQLEMTDWPVSPTAVLTFKAQDFMVTAPWLCTAPILTEPARQDVGRGASGHAEGDLFRSGIWKQTVQAQKDKYSCEYEACLF